MQSGERGIGGENGRTGGKEPQLQSVVTYCTSAYLLNLHFNPASSASASLRANAFLLYYQPTIFGITFYLDKPRL